MAILYRNEVGYHCACDHCATVFDSQRATAKFCSSACRTAANRERAAHERRLKDFMQEAARLVRYAHERQLMRSETLAALERVQVTIQQWNSDPTPNPRALSVFGWNAFEFDKDSVTTAL